MGQGVIVPSDHSVICYPAIVRQRYMVRFSSQEKQGGTHEAAGGGGGSGDAYIRVIYTTSQALSR